jgi:anti-sigma factor RsiW|nr:zf-HC2 domain-containing protein [Candidatus Krumholzibacteria bacterium]
MTLNSHPEGEILQAYHDGELPAAEAAEVRAHCEQCEVCRSQLADLKMMNSILGCLEAPAMSGSVWPRIQASEGRSPAIKPSWGLVACAAGIALGFLLGPVQSGQENAATSLAWSENVTVWNTDATSSLLGVFQITAE